MLGISGLSLVFHRKTAAIVGLICIWLSTVGALHHDEVLPFTLAKATQSQLHKTVPVAPSGPCTACEWEQTLGTSNTPPALVLIMMPGVHACLLRERASALIITRYFDYTSLRAPPALS